MVLPFFPRRIDSVGSGSGRGEEPGGAKLLRLIQIRLTTASFEKIPQRVKIKTGKQLTAAAARCPYKFSPNCC
jgi:hypothetical protein